MRQITLIATLLLTGCSSTGWLFTNDRAGYTSYDPCIRCGEKWVQLPNERFQAQKMQALCQQGIDTQINCY